MARLAKDFGIVYFQSVDPVGQEKDEEWGRNRTLLVGQSGHLCAYTSERRYPGKQFLLFVTDYPNMYLQTSGGNLIEEEGCVILETKNSRYTFKT